MKCENLNVWKKIYRLSVEIYKPFKACKDYGFKEQILRASLSIPGNIAESMERASMKDQIHFLDIAKGSIAEFFTHTYISMDIQYIEKAISKKWIYEVVHPIAMTTKIQQSLRKKIDAK